jgi:hypothetical protein
LSHILLLAKISIHIYWYESSLVTLVAQYELQI